MHGQKRSRRVSEFGLQLRSKQKVRNSYRLLEKQFKLTVKRAIAARKDPYALILKALENRLDNAVFRAGFAQSRDQARQIVGHGHIKVNGRRVSTPSYSVRQGDEIAVREQSKMNSFFSALAPQWLKKYEPPAWIDTDKDKMTARIKGQPSAEESGIQKQDIQSIIEFYSR